MPSKKSKPHQNLRSRPKAERGCSEPRIAELAGELAQVLRPGDKVLLEGPMGAGKSTFARALLSALGVTRPPEGSPTFAIAHEYPLAKGSVVHIDFYRMKSEAEIEAAGIPAYFWERNAIVLSEWMSMFEEFSRAVKESSGGGAVWEIVLEFDERPETRSVRITQLC